MKEFGSFGASATHLAGIAAHDAAVGHEMMERIAVSIEKKVKAKIGEYQEQAGPFVTWAELAESTKEDRSRQGYSDNDPGLRSGWMRDSIEHKSSITEAHVGSNDDKM